MTNSGTDSNNQISLLMEKMDVIITLLLRPVREFDEGFSPLQMEILKYCDNQHSTEEISKLVKKKSGHVNKELSILRAKGAVKTFKNNDRIVHVRL